MSKLKQKKKQQIVFNSKHELSKFINENFKTKINAEIRKYHANLEKEVQEEVAKSRAEYMKQASIMLIPLVLNSLYEAYGIGSKRAVKFIEYFNKHIECYNDGIVDYDSYVQWCKDMGYKFIDVKEVKSE